MRKVRRCARVSERLSSVLVCCVLLRLSSMDMVVHCKTDKIDA